MPPVGKKHRDFNSWNSSRVNDDAAVGRVHLLDIGPPYPFDRSSKLKFDRFTGQDDISRTQLPCCPTCDHKKYGSKTEEEKPKSRVHGFWEKTQTKYTSNHYEVPSRYEEKQARRPVSVREAGELYPMR